MYQIKFY